MRKLGCLGLVAGLAVIAALFLVMQGWGGAGPAPRNLTVTIDEGSSLTAAAEQLEKAGAISSASRFTLFAKLFGGSTPIRAGEYRLPAHISQSDILKLLQGGKTLQRFVTIPEGWPAVMVREAL